MLRTGVIDIDITARPYVDESTCIHFMVLAFVLLFLFEQGAFANTTRPVALDKGLNKFYAHLVSYFDRRYVR